jgi:NADPH2:quinone reductase
MKAVVLNEFGGPEQLRLAETPDPDPGPGECLIATEACDVLFLDTMLRSGNAPPEMRPTLPWVPGNGLAGRVVAVGDGVPEQQIGRLVGAHTGNQGAYAELAVAAVQDIVPIPDGVDVLVGAALLHDGPTALKLAQVTAITDKDTVLVLGASGGLGIALLQLARARARRVIAVARDQAKRERIAALGPDAVIDPEDPDWLTRALEALGPAGASVILDNVGPSLGSQAFALLADGGRFSAHATHGGDFTVIDPKQVRDRSATVTGIEQVQLPPRGFAALTVQAFASAAAGELQPVIGQTFPLEQAAQAHRAIESRHVFGKTLLTVAR